MQEFIKQEFIHDTILVRIDGTVQAINQTKSTYVDKRLPIYTETEKRIGYGAITLRREGEYTIVEVEYEGVAVPVIKEFYDDNFCHTITAIGIAETIDGWKEEILKNARENDGTNSGAGNPAQREGGQ